VANGGLRVGAPTPIEGREVVAAGAYLAELETFVDHVKPPPEWSSYVWMYGVMGRLHRCLADVRVTLPRPAVATYGPPRSLRRWLAVTEGVVASDPEAREIVTWVRRLMRLLDRQWVPAASLPCQLVHGDVRLGNVATAATGGEPVHLDFGFAGVRPRIHDLAYSLPWIVIRPDGAGRAEDFE
jgi:Ser/Thr protein kinase RdoA (MazF antagonist)